MSYRGYTAKVEFEPEHRVWYGKIADIRDLITFETEYKENIEKEFIDTVDDYLAFCEEVGKEPDRPQTDYQAAIAQAKENLADAKERGADAIGDRWSDVRKRLFTPEQLAASEEKLSRLKITAV